VIGRGRREMTEEVETGNGEDVYDVVDVANSRCRVTTEEEAIKAWNVSGVELARRAMEVGEGVLGGRANVWDILVTSADNTCIEVEVATTTPLSSDHSAVAVEGRLSFLTTCDRRGL
jgi:hypothetical protein